MLSFHVQTQQWRPEERKIIKYTYLLTKAHVVEVHQLQTATSELTTLPLHYRLHPTLILELALPLPPYQRHPHHPFLSTSPSMELPTPCTSPCRTAGAASPSTSPPSPLKHHRLLEAGRRRRPMHALKALDLRRFEHAGDPPPHRLPILEQHEPRRPGEAGEGLRPCHGFS